MHIHLIKQLTNLLLNTTFIDVGMFSYHLFLVLTLLVGTFSSLPTVRFRRQTDKGDAIQPSLVKDNTRCNNAALEKLMIEVG